jgi:virulence factor
MLYQQLVNKYRSLQKLSYLKSIGNFKKSYAFIGVGPHSINNLYPCLQHLNVPLKYIYSRTLSNAEKISGLFPGSAATDDWELILKDAEVKAVFISVQPAQQAAILKQALQHGKHVFVEKPPCQTIIELDEIIALSTKLICYPALQRRNSTITKTIQKHRLATDAETYRYTFHTGMYPEDEVETGLFIHAIDFILGLFGDTKNLQIQKFSKSQGVTYQLQLEHSSGVKGQVELSTLFAWNNLSEILEINSPRLFLSARYPNELWTVARSAILNVPIEKLRKGPLVKKLYIDYNDFSPVLQNNTLVLQGFYNEITEFLGMCETDAINEKMNIGSLKKVYKFIEELKATK